MSQTTKIRLRNFGLTAGLVGTVTVTSTGCTPEEINNFMTLLKIIGIFI